MAQGLEIGHVTVFDPVDQLINLLQGSSLRLHPVEDYKQQFQDILGTIDHVDSPADHI
jgi:hypothetical protein